MDRFSRRARAPLSAWAISALVHGGVASVYAVIAQPLDLKKVGELVLAAQVAAEPEPLEILQLSEDENEVQSGAAAFELALDVPVVDAPTLELPVGGTDPPWWALGEAPRAPDLSEKAAMELVPLEASQRPEAARRRRRTASSGRDAGFFGTVAYGDDFVYVLDMSGSMAGRKFDRARDELLRSVDALRPDQSFCVVLFSDRTRPMFDDDAPKPLSATDENKHRLHEWLNSISPAGGTDPRLALALALRTHPSAVFLLSDGEFNLAAGTKTKKKKGSLRQGDPTVPELVDRHARRRTPIHTFAYESQAASPTMEGLANQTGGEFRFIPAPSDDEERAARALAMLKDAQALAAAGQWPQALASYRQIIDSFPGTAAAQQAEGLRLRLVPAWAR